MARTHHLPFLLRVLLATVLGVVATSSLALAQPKTSAEWFNVGDNHYNLGEFDKAIEAFRKAFELEKDDALKPIYLYNIAQAYRQAGDCDNAVFFYKRFLSLKAADVKKPLAQATKDDILKRIAEQEKLCAEKKQNRDKPPEGTMRPSGKDGDEPKDGDDDGEGKEPTKTPTEPTRVAAAEDTEETEEGEDLGIGTTVQGAKLISLRVGAGLAIPNLDPVEVGNQFSASIIAGYPLALGPKLGLDVGAAFGFSPLQWQDGPGATQTSMIITAVANAGLRFEVVPKVHLRADAGLGVLFFTNVAESNPFTENGQAADGGALTMFHVRGGAAAEYELTSQVTVWASPLTFGYSPAKAGLLSDAITQISFLAGAGYRM